MRKMTENKRKHKVLIVDDATYVRNRLKKIVDKLEIAEVVGEASNGEEAVSLYKDLKPDLVTMDLVMPNYDGLRAIDSIIKYDKAANIVVVSAMGQELSVTEAMQKGAKEYIKKPFKDDDVSTIFERLLSEKK
ncbi:MAG: response regulator [Candidatus Hermodarchaeota archaeon]